MIGALRARALYLAAALLPLAAAVASVVIAIDGDWSAVTARLVRDVTPDALLYSAVCSVVAAPLAGVAVAAAQRAAALHSAENRPVETVRRLAAATLVFTGVSASLSLARLGVEIEALRFVATSHAVLASATLALTALGAWLGSRFREPLDAAGVGLLLALGASYGILVGGAPVGELPASLLKGALLASPVMTVATAAHVDLVRSEIWYQVSPLAHVRLEYAAWTTACASYLLAGGVGFLASMWGSGQVARPVNRV